ncbi:hypothetical protein G4Y79_04555 [Phototrophicus methaneseepsis]|uniref:Replication initiation factor n=1 Tax=Phototrophicus methaneseepsis TaxID=2710758 RepID=A0A7S8EAZ8_9CHLR|nr:hypothetical protein [Phototrophicus methaneseepsis]QPC83658.1 hypothetical protein G4Y79_04555 [Phototrophicus methaneseepsis]
MLIRTDADNPRPVSRGLKLQPAFLGVDSLYLVIEYPSQDVFDYWSRSVNDNQDRRLHEGIPHGDMLIRTGAHGYKLCVRSGDNRLYITNRVEDVLHNTPHTGQGMGILLQLGTKWLRQNADFTSYEALSASIFALLREYKVDEPECYPIRINRIDIALDVLGLSTNDISIDEWRRGWIGRASGKYFYDDNTTGNLSGFVIGSSKGAVRFKIYDKILESTKTNDIGFWLSVWIQQGLNFSQANDLNIARFEWTVKPHNAKFLGMRYLEEYTFDGLKELINYLTQKWGRLCIAQASVPKSRWMIHPLWQQIRRLMIEEWDIDHVGITQRDYHTIPDVNPAYLKSVAGWIAGLMARIAIAKGEDAPVDVYEAILLAQSETKPIKQKAQERFEILSRLVTKAVDDEQ